MPNVGPNDYYILLLLVFCHEISFSFRHVAANNSVYSLLWPNNGVNLFGKDEKEKKKIISTTENILCVLFVVIPATHNKCVGSQVLRRELVNNNIVS